MVKQIRLKKLAGFTYDVRRGHATYHVVRHLGAGRPNRFDVYVRTSEDPVTIGRELDLGTVRAVILAFEAAAEGYTGSRREALKIHKAVVSGRII